MKLKFKIQAYQTNAIDAVLGCFAGQPKSDALRYRIELEVKLKSGDIKCQLSPATDVKSI